MDRLDLVRLHVAEPGQRGRSKHTNLGQEVGGIVDQELIARELGTAAKAIREAEIVRLQQRLIDARERAYKGDAVDVSTLDDSRIARTVQGVEHRLYAASSETRRVPGDAVHRDAISAQPECAAGRIDGKSLDRVHGLDDDPGQPGYVARTYPLARLGA